MSDKLIFTRYNGFILTARKNEKEVIEMNFEPEETGALVGNIYVGRVENVVKNINAAFVTYEKGKPAAYLPLGDKVLHQGELVTVQIVSEAVKTKPPRVSMEFSIAGRYAVITHGKPGFGISSKITDNVLRNKLKEQFEGYVSDECGLVIRTNASLAVFEAVKAEIEALMAKYREIIKNSETRSACTLLHEEEKAYIKALRSVDFNEIFQVVTDDRVIFEEVCNYINQYSRRTLGKMVYIDDDSVLKLYGLETAIKHALSEKVWLKCGGYIVIQPTEALTVIDVNSGKCVLKKKAVRETIKKVNLEAAEMIAKQLRLRNLSGIIIVDFIDMEDEEDRKELLKVFGEYIKADPVKTLIIDITKLNLVEITRQKIRKPVYEQLLRNFHTSD